MMESQRIDRSLDAARAVASQRGFTLVEMMVTIAILAVLLAVAVGGWRQLEQANAVEGAIERIRSAMSAARIKAQTSGRSVYVAVDFDGDRLISEVWGGVYDAAAGTWSGSWTQFDGVDVLAGTAACAASNTAGIKLFEFKPSGTVKVTGGGTSKTVMARLPGGGGERCLVVNTITGRARTTP
ncbi:MAG: GspH/FimT family pseudopilin [Mariprofundaceae bacterium]